MRFVTGLFSTVDRPPDIGAKVTPRTPLTFGVIDATSNAGRGGCCANAIQRGASEPASINPAKAIALVTTPLVDARGEKVRPRRSSISMRSPMFDLPPKIPTASRSRDSVRIGLFHVIDHEHFDGGFRRLQSQPELILQRGEQRGSV